MNTRREFIASGLALALPAGARAQAARRLPTIGFVGFASAAGDRQTIDAVRAGLAGLGHREGETIRFEAHSTNGDVARAHALIGELAERRIDVFLSPGPAATRAIIARTKIPVVAIGLPTSDPGLFHSLARPGGSVTGFSTYGEELSAKRIEILKEALPKVATIGVMHNGIDPTFTAWGEQTIGDARRQGLAAIRLALSSTERVAAEDQIKALRQSGGAALIVVRDFLTSTLTREICEQGLAEGIAVVGEFIEFARAGALFSYGPDIPDLFRRAAGYLDRIVKGENPADLPIQLPTKFEFVINLKTAAALGLSFPPSILLRADEVIE